MFKYEKALKVTAKEIYDLLLEEIAFEASEKSGKKHEVKDIEKGCRYNYKRKNGNKQITAYVDVRKPSLEKIETIYEMSNEKYVFCYLIKDEGANCVLTYTQEGGKQSGLADFFMKRQMSKRFAAFERTIIQRRKETA